MQNFGLILTKVLTALTCLGCATLTVWSLVIGLPIVMSIVCFLLTAVTGFFTYVDLKNFLANR